MSIVNTKYDKHLCNYISCDFYHINHGLINEFCACDWIALDNLHITYCMHMYGCELHK